MALSPSSAGGTRSAVADESEGALMERASGSSPGGAEEEDVTEAPAAKRNKDPRLPTREEIDEHNITHLPRRD